MYKIQFMRELTPEELKAKGLLCGITYDGAEMLPQEYSTFREAARAAGNMASEVKKPYRFWETLPDGQLELVKVWYC